MNSYSDESSGSNFNLSYLLSQTLYNHSQGGELPGYIRNILGLIHHKLPSIHSGIIQHPESIETKSEPQWRCVEYKLDMSQIEQIQSVSFWTEGVFQFSIGIVGITFNIFAIPILSSKKMKNIFNKLLISLLVLHSIYICCVLLTKAMWKETPDEKYHPESFSRTLFIYSYSYFLHPLKRFVRISSTFLTILIARERYLAVRHPIQYRNSNLGGNQWIPVIRTLLLVLATAALITFPIYLETSVEKSEVSRVVDVNTTHSKYVSNS